MQSNSTNLNQKALRLLPEGLLIHMYRTTMHTMDTAITMMVAGAQ